MNWTIIYSPFCTLLVVLFIKYFFGVKKHYFHSYSKNYCINNKLALSLLVLCTGFVFLGNTLTFIRFGILFILLIYSISFNKLDLFTKSPISDSYFIFYIWIAITFIYSEGRYEGLMMLVKLAFPFLFLILGYNSITKKEDFIIVLKYVCNALVICIITIGIEPIGNITRIIVGKEFFDENGSYFCATLSSIPLSLFYLTHKKKYLLLALSCFLPSLTYIRRASLMAACISFSIFLLSKYKIKAILPLSLFVIIGITIVFTVPDIKQRVFGGDKGNADITLKELRKNGNITENINTSGREKIWSIIINKFYQGNEVMGCGLGTMKAFLVSDKNPDKKAFQILHNDYLHLLCESGIISIILWAIFVLTIFRSVIQSFIKKEILWIKLSGIIALCSFSSILFIMFFANVISTPFLFIIPFTFIGFYMKLKKIYGKNMSNSTNIK